MGTRKVYQAHFVTATERYYVAFGGTMSKAEAQAEVDRLNGKPEIKKITFRLFYHDGEYLSGYTLHGDDASELEALGLARYISGWGYIVDDAAVKALGTRFSHKAAVEYSQPARERKLAEQRREEKRIRDAFEFSRITKQQVLLRSYSAECDDPREECSLDMIREYAMPDGSTNTTRTHTY